MANDLVHEATYEASARALEGIVDATAVRKHDDPKTHLHRPADHAGAHALLGSWIPPGAMQKLESSHHLGNFVIDRNTGAKTWESMSIYVRVGMHLLYYGSRQEKVLQWSRVEQLLRDQSLKLGQVYDRPDSVAHIEPFINSFDLWESLAEMKQPDPTRYLTFNEFFAREIRPDMRPIDLPDDDLVSSSPADCRLTAFQTVYHATLYWIKGFGFTVPRLVGDEKVAAQFEGGSIVIARLAPQDYHRWHAPISGTVESVTEIPGQYYTVNPQAINEPGTLNVFCENRRSVMLVRRSSTGSVVAIVAIGAMLVGSIRYVNGVEKPGAQIKRGDCLGAFYYGGSTVVVLYPKDEITLDQDLVTNSADHACETYMRVGWRLGTKTTV